MTRKIVVVGSINYDMILTQHRLPRRGETLPATSFRGAFGGKGANQAVQAARLGADVTFIGATGEDDYGRQCHRNLEAEKISCRLRASSRNTGLGVVHVTHGGEVFATIYEGANRDVDVSWIEANEDVFDGAAALILQNEIPQAANRRAVELADRYGLILIYNAAPARPLDQGVDRPDDWFVVNEDEAGFYLGEPVGEPTDREAVTRVLRKLQQYCPNVVLTLGRDGSYLASGARVEFVEAQTVKAVDSTGAGDSFIGAFTAALVEGREPMEAARKATMVAAVTVTSVGAQSSMPTREVLQNETVRPSEADS